MALAAAGCSSSKIGGTGTPPNTTVSLAPGAMNVNAGAAPILFTATVTGGQDTVTWSLSPAGIGSLSALEGTTTKYTPPASVSTVTNVQVQATLTLSHHDQSAQVTISPTGSLHLHFDGVPPGLSTQATITGPQGYSANFAADATLTGLPLGAYTTTVPGQTRVHGTIVDVLYTPTVNNPVANVQANTTSFVDITYPPVPTSGRLWVPFIDGTLRGYAGADLATAGISGAPDASTISSEFGNTAVAVDSHGNIWAAKNSAILRFPTATVPLDSLLNPDVWISGVQLPDGGPLAFNEVYGMTFDPSGNLWFTHCDPSYVARIDAAELRNSVSTPLHTVLEPVLLDGGVFSDGGSLIVGSMNCPLDLAFDSNGSLWFVNAWGYSVGKFAQPATLSGVMAPSPSALLLYSDAGAGQITYNNPYGLAFGEDGSLWIANYASGTVVRHLAPQSFAGILQPAVDALFPVNVVFPDGGTMPGAPQDLAFDNAGNLWVGAAAWGPAPQNAILEYPGASFLTGRPTPSPSTCLTNTPGLSLGKMVFSPTPANLPIYAP
jgi:sugar lactone lactonase YvrE